MSRCFLRHTKQYICYYFWITLSHSYKTDIMNYKTLVFRHANFATPMFRHDDIIKNRDYIPKKYFHYGFLRSKRHLTKDMYCTLLLQDALRLCQQRQLE